MKSDFVLISWQETDLPIFGQIQDIFVINGLALLVVTLYHACDYHFHSYLIEGTGETATKLLSSLAAFQTFRSHLKSGSLLITFRSLLRLL